ncbi:phosphoribosyltransferase [Sabulicella glaciei]|uniref:Phosphoribosyltransferase family protein n=1 Tax=Sabulicella glaciei TaxID=2984948 RepID=A0ABT3NTY5_9PROT|nr:phosphoribosyltransferase family protein [Roseococcus sp. MDT2-1-1]MCW8085621.1 phosphoribosyltransferase family protein [Roseococcus sp. MDT2-1-1]
MARPFRNREEAGRRLAGRLEHLRGAAPLVLALPRGGVPVAAPIAEALGAKLDLLLARKVGAPGQPELAVGAVVEGDPPDFVVNDTIIRALGVPASFIEERRADEVAEIARRRRLWLGDAPPPAVGGRVVILVDDGIATGATIRVALAALARMGAARRIVAAPVAPAEVATALRAECDEAIILEEPASFDAVGFFFEDFRQVDEVEMLALLRR